MKEVVFENLLKTSHAYALLKNDFSLGLGHAYMLVSADDDVVAEYFSLIAATVFCETKTACFSCNECAKVIHGNHPGIIIFNAEGKNIKVAEVLELTSSTELKSYSGATLYFVYRADKMNSAAQNKLLKTLEEPPAGVTIFLGVANEAAMLETIKSRCRVVHVDFFESEIIAKSLVELGCAEDVATIAATASDGMPGKAYKIATSPEYTALYTSVVDMLKKLKKSSDIMYVDRLSAYEKEPLEFLDTLSSVFREILAQKQNGESLSKSTNEDIINLAAEYSSHAIGEIILLINQARRKLSLNVNALSTIDSLLFSILEVKYKWQ